MKEKQFWSCLRKAFLIHSVLVRNINERLQIVRQHMKLFCRNLNLFPSIPPSTDEHQLRNERIATWLFIALLALSLSVLVLYTSLINITQTITVDAPSVTKYTQLHSKYSQTLTCPCTTISINYGKMLHLHYTLHQVCSSVFVTQSWIQYLSVYQTQRNPYIDDFRWSGMTVFEALRTICVLIDQTITNRLMQFYANQYVTAAVTSSEVFSSQVEAFISQFISSVTNDFLLSLLTIRDTTQSNALANGQLTNYEYGVTDDDIIVYSDSRDYGDCNCASSAACTLPFTIHNDSTETTSFRVPGLYMGCYVIESLFQSDLHCFFNQTCIEILQSYFNRNTSLSVTALNKSLMHRFAENSTIEELVSRLMVEEWNSSVEYESYYTGCRPSQCTYAERSKNDVIYIVTTIVGLIGGLLTVLKLSVPRLVMFARRKKELARPQNGKRLAKTASK
jgi:hypothetical protein